MNVPYSSRYTFVVVSAAPLRPALPSTSLASGEDFGGIAVHASAERSRGGVTASAPLPDHFLHRSYDVWATRRQAQALPAGSQLIVRVLPPIVSRLAPGRSRSRSVTKERQ
jgi:hypothetical protein